MTDETSVRRAWRFTEPLHALIYFVPEAPERYAKLGIDAMAGYVASRPPRWARSVRGGHDEPATIVNPRP